MAKVSLRIYNREIERLIEQERMDEAVAHCRHILKTFPKHLETYRLLGKAFLELRRYNEAVDVFGRVLMAVPDDFVAHVGLSIIRDEENKLDDAIWHMERAFEAQPSNAAIQGELQRLYGRRDGVEPPKVRMTRGALAHMYVQGELYPQAIAEIRAVLAQDPQRSDMQVLLAAAYFKGGQKSDASDICNQLLKRYPYCFDANRIMVDLLPATAGAAESTQVYRMRVGELDPYAIFSKGSAFQINEVPDASVNLERLEYSADDIPTGQEWSSSLGIGFDASAAPALGAPSFDDQPDWLKSGGFANETLAAAETQQPASVPAPPFQGTSAPEPQDEIPDFLRSAGWRESNTPEQPTSIFDEEPADGLVPANLPDWLKGQAPVSDDLARITEARPDISQPTETPDWLSGLGSAQASDESAQPTDIPDWLRAAEPKSEPAPSIDTLGTSTQEQDDAVAWLESLAAKHGAKPEELVTDPNKRSESPPEWVKQAQSIGETQPVPSEEPAKSEWVEGAQNIGEQFFAEFETASTAAPATDETGLWLRDLDKKEKQEEATEEQNLQRGDIPEWLSDARQPLNTGDQFAFSEQKPAEESSDLPNWLSGLDEETPAQETSFADQNLKNQDLSSWLSNLDNEPGLDFDPEIIRASARPPYPRPPEKTVDTQSAKTDLPDWLSGMDAEQEAEDEWKKSIASTPNVEPAPVPLAADLPDWLQGVDEATGEAGQASDDDAAPWLHRERWEAEVTPPQQPKPTSPSDWHPLEEKSVEAHTPKPVSAPARSQPIVPYPPSPQPSEPAAAPSAKKKPGPSTRQPKVEGQTNISVLNQAKGELDRGDIPTALTHYGKIIKKGKHLEETIRDLSESLYRYPVEVGIWQTLGDAYMRANRLKEALEAYNKAEELIR